ncbi:MAG: hypothetical protein DBX59_05150 [Bacillota bacterium]|nr:MAG: hypothetical protein DBX59_05150 [Bacillota bacterium]
MRESKLYVPRTVYTVEYDVGAMPHQHAQWEFALFPSGNFVNHVNKAVIETKANTIIVLGPMHKHSIAQLQAGSKHRDIYIGDEELREILNLFDKKLYSRISQKEEPLFFSVSVQVMQNIIEELKTVESLQTIEKYSPVLKEITHSLIAYILGLAIKEEYFSENFIPQAIVDFLDLLQIPENLQKKLTDLVAYSGYSYSYFSVLFQKYTGQTLRDYFLQARFRRAVYLLTSGHLSILEIAYDVGYDSVSAFIAKFKEIYNCTPFAYRANHTSASKK